MLLVGLGGELGDHLIDKFFVSICDLGVAALLYPADDLHDRAVDDLGGFEFAGSGNLAAMQGAHHVGDGLCVGNDPVLHRQLLFHRQFANIDRCRQGQVVHRFNRHWLGSSRCRLGQGRCAKQGCCSKQGWCAKQGCCADGGSSDPGQG